MRVVNYEVTTCGSFHTTQWIEANSQEDAEKQVEEILEQQRNHGGCEDGPLRNVHLISLKHLDPPITLGRPVSDR